MGLVTCIAGDIAFPPFFEFQRWRVGFAVEKLQSWPFLGLDRALVIHHFLQFPSEVRKIATTNFSQGPKLSFAIFRVFIAAVLAEES